MTTASYLVLILTLCTVCSVASQDGLDSVRKLYGAAQYEAALSSLDRLDRLTDENPLEIARYRALCLIGLGRAAEADQVIERIVSEDPLYQPDAGDSSPAVRSAFTAVRRRLLPDIALRLFSEAKAAYARKALAEAAVKFQRTLEVLDSPELANHADLVDLRELTAGFWELTRHPLPAGPTNADSLSDNGASTITSSFLPDGRRRPDPNPIQLSDPKPLRQDMPRWTFAMSAAHYDGRFRATVEVEIGEAGDVTGVEILYSTHPSFNRILTETARRWKYNPTLRDGKPVKARKRVDVVLRPQ